MTNKFEPSTTLNDFTIERVIGKGSFGSVFLVKRKFDQKLYALKSVFLDKLNKKEQENSVNEVRLLASVSHPNVISYKESFFDEKNNSLNIIMEYADDGDLQTEINKKKKNSETFDEKIIWLYSIQMIEGLKALHDKKIMHRDLKSANIFLSKNKLQCKLGDMNVSKVIKEKVLMTQTGTPYYASPEVWRDEPYSYKSDLWSIGCVIYEMCNLEPPFNGKDLDELFENVCSGKLKRINICYSEDLWEMILMLLQNDVERRVNCDEFLESELIKKKIEELKDNPDINYEAYLLEKNIEIKNENNVLLQTIKFKNFNELKNNLPTLKNYESNYNKRTINNSNNYKSNSSIIYTSKNNSLDALVINSNIKKQNIFSKNINHSLNNRREIEKVHSKKSLINKNISYSKEKENKNPNHSIQIYNNDLEQNSSIKIHYKKNITNSKSKKNFSIKGKIHTSYIAIPTKDKKGKKFKDFEKIIEMNKIKELLKINRKKEKSIIKTERSKNDLNKNNERNLLRNKTDNNRKKIIKKIQETNGVASQFKKSQPKKNYINQNKIQNLIKRASTEQRKFVLNKIYKLNVNKLIQKKLKKSHTSLSIKLNTNKDRSHSHNGIGIKKTIQLKNKLKNLYFNIFNNISLSTNDRKNKKFIIKNKIPTFIPFLISKEKSKSKNRNLTTIPYNQNSYNNNISTNNRKNRLLNEVFKTVNFNQNKRRIKSKNNKIIPINDKRALSTKNKKLLNDGFNENSINIDKDAHTISNIYDNSIFFEDNNNKNKKKNLFNFKNYSIIMNKGYKQKNNKKEIKNKNNSININDSDYYIFNLNLSKKYIKQKTLQNQKNNEFFIPMSFRQKTLNNSIGSNNNKSNLELIIKRNIKYNFSKNKNNNKNISIKKLNIPQLYSINKSKNNFLEYKRNFKSQKNMFDLDNNNYIKSNREKNSINLTKNKNLLNISESNNYIISNHNTFLQNMKPIYLDIKNNDHLNILYKKKLKMKGIKNNKRINTSNSGCNIKKEKIVKSQIFNNFFSINNFDSNHPVRVINFYN